MDLDIRNATPEDLPELMRVEASWPERARASEEKLLARMEKFSRGFFVGVNHGRLVATVTSCPVVYDPEHLENFSDWDSVTNSGFLHETSELSRYNALYIVSGIIDKEARGANVFAPMMSREIELAAELGFGYVCAGAVLPGYAAHCEKHGRVPAEEYVFLRRGRHLVDPLLDMYRQLDFRVPDKRHVKRDYFPDEASLNYAAIVVRKV